MILGVIADDFTGATDVAGMLVGAGMRTVQVIGVPRGPMPDADAVVIALKSRTCPPAQAVAQSLQALHALQAAGARQIYFKYCSTFDSTPPGNIGPVADALMDALKADIAIACPAFPDNGRTVFRGHLFVGDILLSDSGMRDHPLTPMTDANLVRVLQPQTRRHVGLLAQPVVSRGADAVRERLQALRAEGAGLAVTDAVANADLLTLGEACADMPLITAGSGVALGLPPAYARRGWLTPDAGSAQLTPVQGPAAVLAGSCSQATQGQVANWKAAGHTALHLDPLVLASNVQHLEQLKSQALGALARGPVLVYATADAASVKGVQEKLGTAAAGELVEHAMARLAQALAQAGVRRLVVAGGETSGAVTQALGLSQLRIGAPISPGVPWTQGRWQGEPLWLALKSGNFGGPDFFAQALRLAGVSL
ncbi:MAG: 3-oxo-tetronate kinase [Ramlibacter sp.]